MHAHIYSIRHNGSSRRALREARSGGGDGGDDGARARGSLSSLILCQLRIDHLRAKGLDELVDADIPAAVHAVGVVLAAPPLAVDGVLQRARARLRQHIATLDRAQLLDVRAPVPRNAKRMFTVNEARAMGKEQRLGQDSAPISPDLVDGDDGGWAWQSLLL